MQIVHTLSILHCNAHDFSDKQELRTKHSRSFKYLLATWSTWHYLSNAFYTIQLEIGWTCSLLIRDVTSVTCSRQSEFWWHQHERHLWIAKAQKRQDRFGRNNLETEGKTIQTSRPRSDLDSVALPLPQIFNLVRFGYPLLRLWIQDFGDRGLVGLDMIEVALDQ